jgi:hypothetical protein
MAGREVYRENECESRQTGVAPLRSHVMGHASNLTPQFTSDAGRTKFQRQSQCSGCDCYCCLSEVTRKLPDMFQDV